MSIESRLYNLEQIVNSLRDSFLQSQRNNSQIVSKTDDTSNKVKQITPYTETKKAYYNEKEKTFYNVPPGYVTVLFDNYNGNYSVSRVSDRATVSFDTLTESTNIKILIN